MQFVVAAVVVIPCQHPTRLRETRNLVNLKCLRCLCVLALQQAHPHHCSNRFSGCGGMGPMGGNLQQANNNFPGIFQLKNPGALTCPTCESPQATSQCLFFPLKSSLRGGGHQDDRIEQTQMIASIVRIIEIVVRTVWPFKPWPLFFWYSGRLFLPSLGVMPKLCACLLLSYLLSFLSCQKIDGQQGMLHFLFFWLGLFTCATLFLCLCLCVCVTSLRACVSNIPEFPRWLVVLTFYNWPWDFQRTTKLTRNRFFSEEVSCSVSEASRHLKGQDSCAQPNSACSLE